jgi:hypothetical protein
MSSKIISKQKAEQIISRLNMRDLIKKVTFENNHFYETNAYLDLSDGQVFIRPMSQGESFQANHFILLYSQEGNFTSNLSPEDIAGDDTIPEGGVENFPDYWDRVVEAMIYFAIECKDETQQIYARIEQYYEEQESYS